MAALEHWIAVEKPSNFGVETGNMGLDAFDEPFEFGLEEGCFGGAKTVLQRHSLRTRRLAGAKQFLQFLQGFHHLRSRWHGLGPEGLAEDGKQPLAVVTFLSAAIRVYRVAGTGRVSVTTPRAATDKPSIAVLPFVNVSGAPSKRTSPPELLMTSSLNSPDSANYRSPGGTPHSSTATRQ